MPPRRKTESPATESEGEGDWVEPEGYAWSPDSSRGSIDRWVVPDEDVEEQHYDYHDGFSPRSDERLLLEEGTPIPETPLQQFGRLNTGLEREPEGPSVYNGFKIVRLRNRRDKYGRRMKKEIIELDAPYFPVEIGNYLLEVNNETNTQDEVRVRHVNGAERYVPRRMIETIEKPWGFGKNLQISTRTSGVGLPLAFVTERALARNTGGVPLAQDEAVMVKSDSDESEPVVVIDWEGKAAEIRRKPVVEGEPEDDPPLYKPHVFPWRVYVNPEWLEAWIAIRAPRSKSEKQAGKRPARDPGSSSRPAKRPRLNPTPSASTGSPTATNTGSPATTNETPTPGPSKRIRKIAPTLVSTLTGGTPAVTTSTSTPATMLRRPRGDPTGITPMRDPRTGRYMSRRQMEKQGQRSPGGGPARNFRPRGEMDRSPDGV